MDKSNRAELRHKIDKSFNLSELQELCFVLELDYDDLVGNTKSEKIISIFQYMEKRGRLAQLLYECRKRRPKIDWSSLSSLEPVNSEPSSESKSFWARLFKR